MPYLYKGNNIQNMIYNDGTDSTQGYKDFPGVKRSEASTIEDPGINTHYLYMSQSILRNRIAPFADYTNTNSVGVGIPSDVNYISFIFIGAQGGGAGGQSCDGYRNGSFSGGGGGAGGIPYILCSNKIPKPIIGDWFNVQMGRGGNIVGIGPVGNAQNEEVGETGLPSNFTSPNYNITVYGSNGGYGRGYGPGPAGSGNTGDYTTSLPTDYLLTNANNILQMTPGNYGSDTVNGGGGIGEPGGNGASINNSSSIANTIGLTDFNYVAYGTGGTGSNFTRTGYVNALVGSRGFFRIYYYYN